MKQRFLQGVLRLVVQFLVRGLATITLLAKGMGVFIWYMGKIVRLLGRALQPLAIYLYCVVRRMRLRLIQRGEFFRGQALYFLGHRYFVHSVVVLVTLFASVPALSATDVPQGAFGEQTLLKELAGTFDEEEEIIIDDILPASELESYLEARFQDQPLPPAPELALPLTLEGGGLLRPELPGTAIPLTRTELVEYVVGEGDTIWAIAEKFGISVSTMLWENNLTFNSTIRPGQKLLILPVSGITHVVHKGETLESIAKRYHAAVDEIREYNKVALERIALGTKLIIPGGRPYVAPEVRPAKRREVLSPPALAVKSLGKLFWPTLSRRITQYFKWRHAGLDIGDKLGNPIYAAESGVVEYAGWGRGGWGYTVVVNHGNGLKTRYAHASKVLAETGQQVQKGESLALIGSTGRSTGPHLHLSVYLNGRPVNPLQYLVR